MRWLGFVVVLVGSFACGSMGIASPIIELAININFSSPQGSLGVVNLDGTGALGPASRSFNAGSARWNDVLVTRGGGVAATDLHDISGEPSGVDFVWDANGGNANLFGFSNSGIDIEIVQNFLLGHNRFGSPVDPSRLVFSGFEPREQLEFHFVSQGDTVGLGGSFTINGRTQSTTGSLPASGYPYFESDDSPPFVEGENFVKFESVFADADGVVVVDFDNSPGGSEFQILNGIQIGRLSPGFPLKRCDLNFNGICNSTDFAILRDLLFTETFGSGDLNFDGFVDLTDYRLFKDDPDRVVGFDFSQFGSTPVPEASTAALCGSCLICGLAARRTTAREH